MEQQIEKIKNWLGTGSVNVFGLPMSGKDTVGVKLAELLGAKFLSSGDIIRAMEAALNVNVSQEGNLTPQNIFFDWVLPYFEKKELQNYPLILSSIGRWAGEENEVISVARSSGHPIKAAVMLQLSEQTAIERWEAAKLLDDRGLRADDASPQIFQRRLSEYREKTLPVLRHYQEMGLLVPVKADAPRPQVLANTVEALAEFSQKSQNF